MIHSCPPVAVTGSTGFLGGVVARTLAGAGRPVRLLARDPARAPEIDGAQVFRCSYENTIDTREALAGVQTLFMVSAAESPDRLAQHRAFVDAAVEAGVRHLVYTSFVGAAADATFTLARDHHATEVYLAGTGIELTVLRDNLYLDFMDALVGDDGVIRGPAGDGRVAAVARTDIAAVAARVLLDPDAHRGRTYELSGRQAQSFAEIAAVLSAHRGSEVRYVDETLDQAYASRAVWQAPPWQVDAWVSTYTAIAAGEMSAISNDVETITGVVPLTLAELLAQG